MDYNKSKKVGDIIETEVLKIVQKTYPSAYIDNTGKANSNWDIYIPEKEYGIEVKGDYRSHDTGNLVVEVEMNGRPSALSVTKSEYWVFVEGERLIWIKPIDIYRFIEQNNYQRVSFVGDGDNKSKYAYLIKHQDFVLYVYSIKDGFIQMLSKKSILYFNNYIKKIKEIEND